MIFYYGRAVPASDNSDESSDPEESDESIQGPDPSDGGEDSGELEYLDVSF
jgi:hypothetical protein